MIDFANPDNWLTLYDAQSVNVNGLPIPPIVLADIYDYRFLKVTAINEQAKPVWELGAYVDLMLPDTIPTVRASRFDVDVNETTLIPVPLWLKDYKLRIKPPRWFRCLTVKLDGYTGASQAFDIRYLAINCGGEAFTDFEGLEWLADSYFVQTNGETGSNSNEILGTDNDLLFYSDRYGDFIYTIPTVVNDLHQVTLYFSEPYWTESNSRKFRVRINGDIVLNNFDIYAESGFETAITKTFEVNPIDGNIVIEMETIIDNALLNGFVIKYSNSL